MCSLPFILAFFEQQQTQYFHKQVLVWEHIIWESNGLKTSKIFETSRITGCIGKDPYQFDTLGQGNNLHQAVVMNGKAMEEVVEPTKAQTLLNLQPILIEATETSSLCHRGTAKSREQPMKKDTR